MVDLLVHKRRVHLLHLLHLHGSGAARECGELRLTPSEELCLLLSLHGRRLHWSSEQFARAIRNAMLDPE